MAGNVIKEFLVSLGFQVDKAGEQGFTAGIGKATLAVAGIGAATFAAAGAITAFVAGVARELDVISDLSNRTQVATTDIEQMGYIASLTDSSVGAVNGTLDRLSRTIGEAAVGLGRGATTFKALGFEAKKENGELKTTVEMLAEVKEKIKDMGRGEQLAVLQKMGIDPTMIAMMTQDMSGLSDEFHSLYAGIGYDSEKAAQASSDFMDSQFKLKFVFDTLRKSVATQFMPQMIRAMESLRKQAIENLPKIIAVVKPILGGILKLAGAFITLGMRVAQIAGKVISWLWKISEGSNHIVLGIGLVIAAWKLLNLSFLASPIGIILGLAAALLLLYDDYMTFKEGGDSLINWENWQAEVEAFITFFKLLYGAADVVISAIMNLFIALFQIITGDIDGMVATFQFQLDKMKSFLEGFLNYFGFTFAEIGNFIDGIMEKVSALFDKFTSFKGIKGMLDNVFGPGGSGSVAVTRPDISPAAAQAGAGRAGATVNQNITNNIQSTDPDAVVRSMSRDNNRATKDLARNTAAVAY